MDLRTALNACDHQVNSPEEMIDLGKRLAQEIRRGTVIALLGGLGAGKTHLTKGIAEGLGCTSEVTSPTFSLAHEYRGGQIPLFHFDFYRMESEGEVLRIGWDEYIDENGAIVVEWPNKFPELLPPDTIWLQIETLPGEQSGRRVHTVDYAK
ncbi:tRNA (adenosine(37)-N6)-threonylcarbamoyltransferase complex ATPase subunit type 1 TsaE [Oceaniferula spumae]|uniref:tRNA threonylcarbamoyladenosine biosynthesis protein TsaE n=1 Tax=Oceaniferula spumae TaxID=2979115 RepID=A0AAT9FNB4_9BACT